MEEAARCRATRPCPSRASPATVVAAELRRRVHDSGSGRRLLDILVLVGPQGISVQLHVKSALDLALRFRSRGCSGESSRGDHGTVVRSYRRLAWLATCQPAGIASVY